MGWTPPPDIAAAADHKPSLEQLQYLKTLLELVLLLLAIPYILGRVLRFPGTTMREAGRHHLS